MRETLSVYNSPTIVEIILTKVGRNIPYGKTLQKFYYVGSSFEKRFPMYVFEIFMGHP